MNIEIKPRSKTQELFHKFKSKSEDIFLNLLIGVSKFSKADFIQNWIDRYTSKRLAELKQEIISQRWQQVTLKKVVDNIHDQQQNMK